MKRGADSFRIPAHDYTRAKERGEMMDSSVVAHVGPDARPYVDRSSERSAGGGDGCGGGEGGHISVKNFTDLVGQGS